jgi:hypothetical protein
MNFTLNFYCKFYIKLFIIELRVCKKESEQENLKKIVGSFFFKRGQLNKNVGSFFN